MITKRIAHLLLAAAVLAPGAALPPLASAARKAKTDFSCVGVGRGGHSRGMTESECRRKGGTVERDGQEVPTPARQRATGGRRGGGAYTTPSSTRDEAPAYEGDKFSCRGIGSGHHYKGMTPADCERMGGTVEAPR
jgi:hypothetical protein